MRIISNLSRLLTSILLVMTSPVLAAQFSPTFKNCDVINIGPDLWQAKFDLVINVCSGCSDSTNNTFTAYVPKLSAQGKPLADTNTVANFSHLTTTGTSILGVIGGLYLKFNSTSPVNSNVIRSGSSISVNFSTKGNNAYPALFIRYADLTIVGGTTSSPLWVFPGSCYESTFVPPTIPPIEEINPPDPEFNISSTVWELNGVDVSDLPDVLVSSMGYAASIKNISNSNLCINYVTAGIKNKSYALEVTNNASLYGGRNLFMMQGGTSQLLYNLQLSSNDGVLGNNFEFPTGTTKYITLSQTASSVDKRSEMCWTPKINLFKNASTNAGMHTDILNFVIIPKA